MQKQEKRTGESMLGGMIAFYKQEVAQHPQDVESRAQLAMLLGQSGRAREATREFKTCLSQNPINGKALLMYGTFLCIQGKLAEGIEELKKAVACCSNDSDWMLSIGSLGAASHMFGDHSKATACWEALLKVPPHPVFDFNIHFSLGVVSLQSDKIDRALKEFRYAHSVREDDSTLPRRFPGVILQMEPKRLKGWSNDSNTQTLLNALIPLTRGICRPEDMF